MFRKIRIIAGQLLLVLCLVAVTSGLTVAWMLHNRTVDSDMSRMQINAKGLKIDHYHVYQYDYESGKIKDIYNDEDKYELTQYDSIFEERNSNTLLVFEVVLYNFFPGAENFIAYIDREPPDEEFTGENFNAEKYHVTSNLVYIKSGTAGGLDGVALSHTDPQTDEAIEQKFYAVRDALAEDENRNQFIEVATTNGDKYTLASTQDRMTLRCALSESEKAAIAADGREARVTVYFVLDYDPELVEAQELTHFSDIGILDNLAVEYANDIRSILFEDEE